MLDQFVLFGIMNLHGYEKFKIGCVPTYKDWKCMKENKKSNHINLLKTPLIRRGLEDIVHLRVEKPHYPWRRQIWNVIQFQQECVWKEHLECWRVRTWTLIMKHYEIPFNFIPEILATCIILHNLLIVKNEGFENDWVVTHYIN